MINWHLSETTVKNNTLIQIVVDSVQLATEVTYVVTCPDGTTYSSYIAITDGIGSAGLYINSGTGGYTITLVSDCEAIAVPSKMLIVSCCTSSAPSCGLEILTNKNNYTIGEIVNIYLAGGVPNSTAYIIADNELHSIAIDSVGHGLLTKQLVSLGNYIINAHQNTCLAASLALTVIGAPNAVPSVVNPPAACIKPLTATPKFSRTGVSTGSNVTLTITVCNENSGALLYTLPTLVLPVELASVMPISITAENIPAKTCRDFNFIVSTSNTTNQQITSTLILPAHTYVCEAITFSVLSGETSIAIFAASQSCGLEVSQFTITSTGTGTAQIKIIITNLGSGSLAQLTLYPVVLPTSLGGGTLDFNNVALASGATYVYIKNVALVNTTGAPLTAVIFIPTNGLSAVCGGTLLVDDESHVASLVVPA